MPRVLLKIDAPDGPLEHAWDPDGGPLTFGRSASADLSILSDTLSREHGRLQQDGAELTVTDLGSRNGLRVNGRRIDRPTAVGDGDQISVGEVTLTLQIQPDPAESRTEVASDTFPSAPPAPPVPSTPAPSESAPLSPTSSVVGEPDEDAQASRDDGANWLELTETGERATASVPPTAAPQEPVSSAAGEAGDDGDDAGPSLLGEALPGLRSFEPTVTQEEAAARETAPPPERRRVVAVPEGRLVLGRDPSCDAPLDSLLVSRRHAEVTRDEAGHVRIRDLQSTNGTTLNGQLLAQPADLKSGDHVGIGPFRFKFDGQALTCAPPQAGLEVRLQGVTVRQRRRVLLDDAALLLRPGRLVGLVGEDPAPPRAVADLLTDRRRPRAGRVLFNGVDRAAYRRAFAATVGYARGGPAMHGSLRLRDVMRTAARLRLSADVPRQELNEHLHRVLETVDLGYALKKRVRRLDATQRFLAGLALQLLTQPQLLVVDTAAGGGSSGTGGMGAGGGVGGRLDAAVWPVLRRLADAGTLVVWLTDDAASMPRCDEVVCLAGGQVVAHGEPSEVARQLELKHWHEVFTLSRRGSAGQAEGEGGWRRRYLETPAGASRDREARTEAEAFSQIPRRARTPWSRGLREVVRQSRWLTGRWLGRRWAEPGWAVVDLLLPAAAGAAVGWIAGGRPWSARGWSAEATASAVDDPMAWSGLLLTVLLGLTLLMGLRGWLVEAAVLDEERRGGLRLGGLVGGRALPLLLEAAGAAGAWAAGWWLASGMSVRDALSWWAVGAAVAGVGVAMGWVLGRLVTRVAGRGSAAGRSAATAWGAGLGVLVAAVVSIVVSGVGVGDGSTLWWAVTVTGQRALEAWSGGEAVGGAWGRLVLAWSVQMVGWLVIWMLLLLPRPRG